MLVTSASSKTSIAFADNARRRDGLRAVGLTSAANKAFVEGLALYDDVIVYDAIDGLPEDDAVLIDMAGNTAVVAGVHARLGDHLRASIIVGASHHDAPAVAVEGGPERAFFFAPTAVSELRGDIGPAELNRRMAAALHAFVDASPSWLALTHREGPTAVAAAWAELVAGKVSPTTGIVASMQ